jgi:putative redox protein
MERRVVVRTAGPSGLRHEVEVGSHRLAADAPASEGGGDAGPAPFEYLLAALGACTSMTMRMYAGRKGWDLRGVEVSLERVRLDPGPGPGNEIRMSIVLEGDLDADQRKRLLEIADRCPVHRALVHGVRMVKTG